MSQANPLWGAPRIHGELLKLGIDVAESTVGKYLHRHRKPPSQTWRTFLTNHLAQMASMDFFTVPTATFRVLFVFVVLSHARRRIVHFAVTEHPTQEWTIQQLREAFPWNQAPRYVLRDRDAIYAQHLAAVIQGMGIEELLTAPRSPWENPYVERLVGSIRRECLDHIMVGNQRSLRRILRDYFAYYEHSRTHLALAKDAPEPRETGARPHRIHCSSRRVAPSLPATSRLGQKRARILARLEFPSRCLRQLHFPDGTNLLDLLDLLDEAGIHWCRAAEPRTQLNGSPGGIERKAAMLAVTAKSSRRSDFR